MTTFIGHLVFPVFDKLNLVVDYKTVEGNPAVSVPAAEIPGYRCYAQDLNPIQTAFEGGFASAACAT